MGKPLRVLVVEDSIDDTKLLLRELTHGGYDPTFERVDTFEAMDEALEKQTWDIVIADYVMPNFSGLAALKSLKAKGIDLPFILMSGQISEQTAVEAMKAGAGDFVLKGNMARLVPAIERELRDAQVRRERRQAEGALQNAYAELELRVKERTAELEEANTKLQVEITERRRAENALLRSTKILQAISQHSPDLIYAKDHEGRLIFASQSVLRLLGKTEAEVLGKTDREFHPDPRLGEAVMENERMVRETRRTVVAEEPTRLSDGSVRVFLSTKTPWLAEDSTLLGTLGISIDITERKRAEEEREQLLKRVEEIADVAQRRAAELQAVLDNMVDGVYVCDVEGRITLANEAGLRLLGLRSSEEAKSNLEELVSQLRARHLDGRVVSPEEMPLARALSSGEIVLDQDQIVTNLQTRRDIFIRTSAGPITDGKGRIVGAVAVARDVTELTELDRLKDQFIEVAAHELKTPVTGIRGYAQYLIQQEHEGVSAQGLRALQAINRQTDRISGIINDLLDISRLQLGRLELTIESIDLPEFVQEVVDRMALTTAKHAIRVVRAEPVVVQGDRGRLEQVLINLLDNAIKYSPQGGPSQGRIALAVVVREREAEVSVTDQGVGIPEEKKAHIFERFYRAHTGTPYDYGGMGVGLYISYEIVKRHGGRMWFESEEGKGSTFYFSLPIAPSAS